MLSEDDVDVLRVRKSQAVDWLANRTTNGLPKTRR